MMRRIWAGIAAAWAVIAVFSVLALTQRPTVSGTTGTTVVMTRTAAGTLVPTATSTTVHATTSSSAVAAPATPGGVTNATGSGAVLYVKNVNGTFVPVTPAPAAAPAAVTRSS
jgi:hypothetical protein